MKISLKLKIRLALIFIFGLLILVVATSYFSLFKITQRTKTVFKANFESLHFVEEMRESLETESGKPDFEKFETNLTKQEANTTEIGEPEATAQLRGAFLKYKNTPTDSSAGKKMLRNLAEIHALNQNAIVRANDETYNLSEKFAFWLAVIATFSLLLAFTFILNFPDYIASPVVRLKEAILKIADKNYSERIREKSNDEFGELATAFNTMAERLDDFEKSNLAKIIREKQRVEAVISLFPDAAIGLDESRKILFVNPSAANLLALKPAEVVGKYAPDVALYNDLLREILKNDGAKMPLKIFADGREETFEQKIFEVSDENGAAIGQFIMLRKQ